MLLSSLVAVTAAENFGNLPAHAAPADCSAATAAITCCVCAACASLPGRAAGAAGITRAGPDTAGAPPACKPPHGTAGPVLLQLFEAGGCGAAAAG